MSQEDSLVQHVKEPDSQPDLGFNAEYKNSQSMEMALGSRKNTYVSKDQNKNQAAIRYREKHESLVTNYQKNKNRVKIEKPIDQIDDLLEPGKAESQSQKSQEGISLSA